MSKQIKEFIENEYKAKYKDVNDLLIVSIRGIGGVDNNQLRGQLKEQQIQLSVVKNSLAKRVFATDGKDALAASLNGPTAIVYGGEDIVGLAKRLVDLEKKLEFFQVKGGYVDGCVLDTKQTKNLAKLPNRAELQGQVITLAKSPGSRLAGAIAGPASYIAGCVKTLAEKAEGKPEAEAA